MTNLERIRKQLSAARRKKVAARVAQLIAEEMTLQELRRARKLTQVRMAKELGIGQVGVSRLEKRADLMISTLRKTVERWAEAYLWWLNSLTARLFSCPGLPRPHRTLSLQAGSTPSCSRTERSRQVGDLPHRAA